MYSYVSKDVVKPCKALCFDCLTKAQTTIKEKYGITFQIYAVGSGSNNLVTSWNKEPFDMDFNVLLQKIPDDFADNLRKLKDTIRRELDAVCTRYGFQMDRIPPPQFHTHTGRAGQLISSWTLLLSAVARMVTTTV